MNVTKKLENMWLYFTASIRTSFKKKILSEIRIINVSFLWERVSIYFLQSQFLD